MMRPAAGAVAAAVLLALAAIPTSARPLPRPGPAEQARTRILDGCVMNSAGSARASNPVPRCRCYAAAVVHAMGPDDLSRYLRTDSISDALRDRAARLYEHC